MGFSPPLILSEKGHCLYGQMDGGLILYFLSETVTSVVLMLVTGDHVMDPVCGEGCGIEGRGARNLCEQTLV